MAKPANGIKPTQRETLEFIQEEGSCTAAELADQIDASNSTAAQRLRNLKNSKLVSSRGGRFFITPSGKTAIKANANANRGGKGNRGRDNSDSHQIEFEEIEFESNKNGSVTISVTVSAEDAAQIVADSFASQIQEAFASQNA